MPPADNRTTEVVVLDREGQQLSCAAKSCSGVGIETLFRWFKEAETDVLFLRNRRGEPVVLLSFDSWNRVARVVERG
jgi:hypothetical protein